MCRGCGDLVAAGRARCPDCGASVAGCRGSGGTNAKTAQRVMKLAGCGVGQEDDFNRDLAEAGIEGAHYAKELEGALVVETRAARDQALALRGMHDNHDGGFDGRRVKSIRRLGLSKPATR